MLVSLVVAGVAYCWGRPWISSDTATGLLAWEGWRAGGPWNCVIEPDALDIARDTASWVSWWSPGQYVWPGLFLIPGMPLGTALIAASLVAAWLRSIGLFILLRQLEVSPRAAGLAVVVEAANWQLFSSFGMFIGGEVLQAAVLPWLLLGLAWLRGRVRWWPVAVPLLLLGAAFAKHTLFLTGLAGLAWLWWETNTNRKFSWRRAAATGLLLAVCAFVGRLAVARLIIGPGPTPADAGASQGWLTALGFPAFAPLSVATGIGSIAGRAFQHARLDPDAGWHRVAPLLLALAPLWIAAYIVLARRLAQRSLRSLFLAVVAAHLVAFGVFYLRGASVSVDDRHFRAAGMLLIVTLAAVAIDSKSAGAWLRRTCLVVLVGGALYGVVAEGVRAANLHRLGRVAPSGLMQPNLSPAAAAELLRLDAQGARDGQVIFFADPAPALETHLSRRIATDAARRPPAWFQQHHWRGRVPRLLLVLPARWVADPRRSALLACFPDYADAKWQSEVVGDCLFLSTGG